MTILTCNSCREPFSSRPNHGDIAIQCVHCIADPGWQERVYYLNQRGEISREGWITRRRQA